MAFRIGRRKLLLGGLFSLITALLAGCGRLMHWIVTRDNSEFSPVSYSFEISEICALNAEAIGGPFYIPEALVRSSLAEGRPGAALRVRFKVVDVAAGCRPVPGAAVDIWHCDALGIYSGFAAYPPDEIPNVDLDGIHEPLDADRFCRGIQLTDAAGFVEFETIIPGWYTPRAPHIHVRVAKPGHDGFALTNQAYFPDDMMAQLYTSEEPYLRRGTSPYTNLNDAVIYRSKGADGGFLRMSRDKDWHVGTLTLGIEV